MCIKAHELIVPDNISVIVIDDILLSRYIDPPLTTIHINKEEMAGFAFDKLVNKLENGEVKSKMISSGQLVIRKSVKPIS
jgi:LacI family transcriptional regulator